MLNPISRSHLVYLQVRRPLWSLPISDPIVQKLKDVGYEYLEDISGDEHKEELEQLVSELKLDLSTYSSGPILKTTLELYKFEQKENGNIVTFSKAIDELFRGGIPTSKITEIVGAPGTGKTQICFQLCVSVQIPEFLGCLSGSAVYIGTNNNFSEKRIKEIHDASVQHCSAITANESLSAEEKSSLHKFVVKNPLLGIIKYSIESVEELRATAYVIQNMLQDRKDIRLLIIDSFTFPFYTSGIDLERTKIISEILNHFNELAIVHRVAVVITNELTTHIKDNEAKEIVPSLGESFAHVIHNRLFLGQKRYSAIRTALLQKSSMFRSGSAYFQVTSEGIRDVPTIQQASEIYQN